MPSPKLSQRHSTFSDQPYWWEIGPPEATPVTSLQPAYDAAIIGAGYTGLSAALTLARAGCRVVVLDKAQPGHAASSRNGGITSGSLRPSFSSLIAKKGLNYAKALYGEARVARADLYRFIEVENIDCDLQHTGRFSGAVCPAHYERLCREAELLNQHLDFGITTIERAKQSRETGSKAYYGGVLWPDIGGLQPLKLVKAYLRLALAAGVEVHSETAVTRLQRNADRFLIHTPRGRIEADACIVATNGYTDNVDPWLRKRLVPVVSRIIATEALSPELMHSIMPGRRMYTETSEMGHYYRPSPDGTRLLFGGRGGALNGNSARDSARLRAEMIELFPQLAQVSLSHSWAGYVAFNRDYIPRLFQHQGIYYATGFCGSGVVWARWAGIKAAQRILGNAAATSSLASEPPAAIPLYRGKPWFLPFFFAWFRQRDQRALKSVKRA